MENITGKRSDFSNKNKFFNLKFAQKKAFELKFENILIKGNSLSCQNMYLKSRLSFSVIEILRNKDMRFSRLHFENNEFCDRLNSKDVKPLKL